MFSKRAACLALALLAGVPLACGKKGEPLPPLRYVPQAAADLAVRQVGTELIVRVAYPKTTTAGSPLPELEAVELWQLERLLPPSGEAAKVEARQFAPAAKLKARFTRPEITSLTTGDRLELRFPAPAAFGERKDLTFAVRFLGPGGELSDFSNLATVAPAAPPPPPTGLALEAAPGGIVVRWVTAGEGIGGFRIYRRLAEERSYGLPVGIVTGDQKEYRDTSAALDRRYIYAVTAVAAGSAATESGLAAEREIDYRDRFPPPPPLSPLALTEPGQARISWTPGATTEPLRYHVYRRDDPAGEWRRLTAEPTAEANYLAAGLVTGKVYAFRITSLDTSGNESAPSSEVEIEAR